MSGKWTPNPSVNTKWVDTWNNSDVEKWIKTLHELQLIEGKNTQQANLMLQIIKSRWISGTKLGRCDTIQALKHLFLGKITQKTALLLRENLNMERAMFQKRELSKRTIKLGKWTPTKGEIIRVVDIKYKPWRSYESEIMKIGNGYIIIQYGGYKNTERLRRNEWAERITILEAKPFRYKQVQEWNPDDVSDWVQSIEIEAPPKYKVSIRKQKMNFAQVVAVNQVTGKELKKYNSGKRIYIDFKQYGVTERFCDEVYKQLRFLLSTKQAEFYDGQHIHAFDGRGWFPAVIKKAEPNRVKIGWNMENSRYIAEKYDHWIPKLYWDNQIRDPVTKQPFSAGVDASTGYTDSTGAIGHGNQGQGQALVDKRVGNDSNNSLQAISGGDEIIKNWSTRHLLKWIKTIGLKDTWQEIMIKVISSTGCTGKDWLDVKNHRELTKKLNIKQPMLANRVFREFRKAKQNPPIFDISTGINENIPIQSSTSNTLEEKPIDEWTSNELTEWIRSLHLGNNTEKKIVEFILEQEVTGTELNYIDEISEIMDSFEIKQTPATKIFTALNAVRANVNDNNQIKSGGGVSGLNNLRNDKNDPYQLLKDWKLDQYSKVLIDEKGYDDVEFWEDLTVDVLQNMGFKEGHAKKFVKKVQQLK